MTSLRRRGLLFLFAAAVLCNINTLKNGFVLDDNAAIVRNTIVTKGLASLREIFTTPYLHGYTTNPNDLYRPLPLALFATEYQLFGPTPMAGHAVNVLLFAACALLLFFFIEALFGSRSIAFIAAGFFVVHPIHAEVVANIKSSDELLCFLFVLLSMLAFMRYSAEGKLWALISGAFCFLLSLLSKETSITFLLIIPLVFLFYKNEHRKRSVFICIFSVVAAAIFVLLRTWVLTNWHANHPFIVGITENSLAGASNFANRLATAIYILGLYLKLLVIPYPLICDHSYNTIPLTTFADPLVIASSAVYLFLIVACIYRFVKNRTDVLAFAIFFYLITLSLFANIFFLVGATMADRFLFFPSVGFCIFLGLCFKRLILRPMPDKRAFFKMEVFLFLFIALAGIYSGLLNLRNGDWKDEPTLFDADIAHAPNNYRLYYYRGTGLINSVGGGAIDSAGEKKLLEGIGYLKRSVAIYPKVQQAWAEIGSTYLEAGEYDSAASYIAQAVAMDPRDTFSMNKLAGAYFKTGNYAASIKTCRIITAIDPRYARAYRNMGVCYLKMEKYDSAVTVLRTALDLDPYATSPYGFLAIAYYHLGYTDSAKKFEATAQQFNPDFHVQ